MHIVLLYRLIRTCTGLIVACAGISCTSFTRSSSIFRLNSYFSCSHLITTTTILTAGCPRGKCRPFAIYYIVNSSKLYHHIKRLYFCHFLKFQHWSKFLLGHGCRLHSRSSDPAPAHSIRWMPSTPAAGPRIHTWSLDLDCKPPAHDWLQGVHAEYGSHWQTPIQYMYFIFVRSRTFEYILHLLVNTYVDKALRYSFVIR